MPHRCLDCALFRRNKSELHSAALTIVQPLTPYSYGSVQLHPKRYCATLHGQRERQPSDVPMEFAAPLIPSSLAEYFFTLAAIPFRQGLRFQRGKISFTKVCVIHLQRRDQNVFPRCVMSKRAQLKCVQTVYLA